MFTDLTHRLRSLIRRRTVEQELDDELRFHRERLVDRHVADGLTHDEGCAARDWKWADSTK
jgi:hypothetical protein